MDNNDTVTAPRRNVLEAEAAALRGLYIPNIVASHASHA
jgi:hypothetical protein